MCGDHCKVKNHALTGVCLCYTHMLFSDCLTGRYISRSWYWWRATPGLWIYPSTCKSRRGSNKSCSSCQGPGFQNGTYTLKFSISLFTWWELQVPRWYFQEPACSDSCYQHQGAPWKAGLISSSRLAEAFLKHVHARAALGCTCALSFRDDKCKQWLLQVRCLHMDFKWDFLGLRSLIEEV